MKSDEYFDGKEKELNTKKKKNKFWLLIIVIALLILLFIQYTLKKPAVVIKKVDQVN